MTRKPSPETVYVARSTGVIRIDGVLHRYVSGRTRVRVGHPLLARLPERFEPEHVDFDLDATPAVRAEA